MNKKSTDKHANRERYINRRATKSALRTAIVASAGLLFWTGHVWSTSDAGNLRGSFVTEALVYDIQRYSRLDVIAKMHAYHKLAGEGRDDKAIRKELHAIDRRFARNSAASGAGPTTKAAWGTAFGVAGGTITRSWQIGAGGKVVGELLADIYHEATGQGRQARTEQRRAQRLLGEGARTTVENALATCAKSAICMRDFRTRFGTRVGPGEDMEQIGRQMPELAEFKSVLEIEKATERNAALIDFAREKIQVAEAELTQAIATAHKETLVGQARIEAKLEAAWMRERRREQELNAAAVAQVKMEGLHSAAYIASTLVGFADPVAGRRLGAVAQATFEIYGAVKKFQTVSKLADGLTGFAGAALAGNVLGAGLALIGTFVDMGPTHDEILRDEVGKLREQVQALHRDMHGRFDRVDLQLGKIYEGLARGFETIELLMERGDRRTWQQLADIQQELERHADELRGLRHLAISQVDMLLARLDATEIGSCVQMKEDFNTMPDESWFAQCLGKIRALVTSRHLEGLQLSERDGNPIDNLVDFPERSTGLAVQQFAAMLPEATLVLPTRVVGPQAWWAFAEAHDRMMSDWPQYAGTVQGTAYGKVMQRYRSDLIAVVDAIASDYARFEIGERSAFGTWFNRVRKRVDAVEGAVRKTLSDGKEPLDMMSWDIAYLEPTEGNQPHVMKRRISDEAWRGTYLADSDRECAALQTWDIPPKEKDVASKTDGAMPRVSNVVGLSQSSIDYIERRIRATLQDGNAGLANMINLGMVAIDTCMYGWSQTTTTPIDRKGRKTAQGQIEKRWSLRQDAEANIYLRMTIDCDGGQNVWELGGDDAVEHEYELVTIEYKSNGGKAPQSIRTDFGNTELVRRTARQAVRELQLHLEDFNNGGLVVGRRECKGALERRYHKARVKISGDATQALGENEHWIALAEELARANAFIAAWVRIAGGESRSMPAAVEAIVTGAARMPNPDEVLEASVDAGEAYLWELPDILRRRIRQFEALLALQDVSRWMQRRGGSLDLRGTAYLGIDEIGRAPNG